MSATAPAQAESLLVRYVGHATSTIELDGVRLLTDPVLRGRVGLLRRQGGRVDPATYAGCHAVLLSHAHADHLDHPSLRLLDRTMPVLAPPRVARALRRRGLRHVEALDVGRSTEVGPLTITATPAVHGDGRSRDRCIGFVVEGSHRLYFAGDTDIFDGMAGLAGGLDAALLPVWGWGPRLGPGHLDPLRAAQALTLLRPRAAVPIHWGTLCPIGVGWARPRYLVEPAEAFFRHATRLAPEVDVRILAAGAATDLTR
jgi:L-ascorbate metabolism protein UlaG (beta-lactamase superfamily)